MFLLGPFLTAPFLVADEDDLNDVLSPSPAPASVWDDDTAKVAYFAEIEPWVLADRS